MAAIVCFVRVLTAVKIAGTTGESIVGKAVGYSPPAILCRLTSYWLRADVDRKGKDGYAVVPRTSLTMIPSTMA